MKRKHALVVMGSSVILTIVFAILAMLLVIAGIWNMVATMQHNAQRIKQTPTPAPHGTDFVYGDMRGGMIVSVIWSRYPHFPEGVRVYDDGHAARGRGAGGIITTNLTEDDWQAVDALRARWCAHPPQFRDLAPDEMRYSVNLNCEFIRVQFVRVPPDELPPELRRLLEVVPTLQPDDHRTNPEKTTTN